MSTTTPTTVDQVGGEAAASQQAAVERRRGGSNRSSGSTGSSGSGSSKRASAKTTETQKRGDMFAFRLTFDELRSLASLEVAATTDDITPILGNVLVRIRDGRVMAFATDRYRVASVDFPAHPDADPGEVMLSLTILKQAISAGTIGGDHKALGTIPEIIVTVEQIASLRHTTIDSASGWRFHETEISGTFPKVDSLFPDEGKPTGIVLGTALNMKMLADAAKVRVPDQIRTPQLDPIWTLSQSPTDSTSKPGPVLFTQQRETARARYLLQPNLVR